MSLTQLITEARTALAERRKKRMRDPSGFDVEELTPKDWKFIDRVASKRFGKKQRRGKGKVYGWQESIFVDGSYTLLDVQKLISELEKYGFMSGLPKQRDQSRANRSAPPDAVPDWEVTVYGRPLRPIPGETAKTFGQRAMDYYVPSAGGESSLGKEQGMYVWEFDGDSSTHDELEELERAVEKSSGFSVMFSSMSDTDHWGTSETWLVKIG
jgi:hypothetical protein